MGLIDRLRRRASPRPIRRMDDPGFGSIRYYDYDGYRTWESHGEAGAVFKEGLQPVSVRVPGTEDGPGEPARRAYHELQGRYDALSQQIATLLFDEFEVGFGTCAPDVQIPSMAGPPDIMKHAGLTHVGISLGPDADQPTFTLTYGFDWDPDHCYDVTVENWAVTSLNVYG